MCTVYVEGIVGTYIGGELCWLEGVVERLIQNIYFCDLNTEYMSKGIDVEGLIYTFFLLTGDNHA